MLACVIVFLGISLLPLSEQVLQCQQLVPLDAEAC